MEKKYAFGVPGLGYVWNGTNSDPMIIYKGIIFNYWDVEDGIDNMVRDDLAIDYDSDIADDDWREWVKHNYSTIRDMLDDWIASSVEAVLN